MRGIVKRRYGALRKEFRNDMIEILNNDRSLAMAIILTRISESRRTQLSKTWYVLGTKYRKEYNDSDFSKIRMKTICGNEDIYRTLYFCGYKDLRNKYYMKLPDRLALGEVYGICLKIVNEK